MAANHQLLNPCLAGAAIHGTSICSFFLSTQSQMYLLCLHACMREFLRPIRTTSFRGTHYIHLVSSPLIIFRTSPSPTHTHTHTGICMHVHKHTRMHVLGHTDTLTYLLTYVHNMTTNCINVIHTQALATRRQERRALRAQLASARAERPWARVGLGFQVLAVELGLQGLKALGRFRLCVWGLGLRVYDL